MSTQTPAEGAVDPTLHAQASEPLGDDARKAIEDARESIAAGDAEAAMQRLRPFFDEDRAQAQLRSWYGLALGLARRRYQEALDLCQSAVKQEFFNPELYVNVAQLNLAYGFRAESLRYLRRAKMIDPGNETIERLLGEMGPRRSPVLGFLPRRHFLNRWLGALRHAVLSRLASSAADEADSESTESERDHVAA